MFLAEETNGHIKKPMKHLQSILNSKWKWHKKHLDFKVDGQKHFDFKAGVFDSI